MLKTYIVYITDRIIDAAKILVKTSSPEKAASLAINFARENITDSDWFIEHIAIWSPQEDEPVCIYWKES